MMPALGGQADSSCHGKVSCIANFHSLGIHCVLGSECSLFLLIRLSVYFLLSIVNTKMTVVDLPNRIYTSIGIITYDIFLS